MLGLCFRDGIVTKLVFPSKEDFSPRDATLLKWMYKQAMNIFYLYIHMSRITVPHFNDQLSAPK